MADGITLTEIGDHRVKAKPYSISPDAKRVYDVARAAPPDGWSPKPDAPLRESLPAPWPKKYLEVHKQPFNPWTFFKNASMLCTHFERTGSTDTLQIMHALYRRLLDYSEMRDGARYIVYRFQELYRGVPIEAPWTSAYASGAALIGLTLLDGCAGMPQTIQTAREVLAGMARPIDLDEDRPDLWVSFVDDSGYLWFEEMPLDQRQQPRILNGHIRALTGLYIYWAHTKDLLALDLLRAGITAVERYALEYRIPGTVNAYDMLQPVSKDYGPERTVAQQDILFRMTGDPVFAYYRDTFRTDMIGE